MIRLSASATYLAATLLAATSAVAQTSGTDKRKVTITYENMTTGQGFAPAIFMSHDENAPPLFKEGEKASFGLSQLAEDGNPGPIAVETGKMMGKSVGHAAIGLPVMPGKSGMVEVEISRQHPMVSGAWMLGMTNDGFAGLSAVNVFEMREAKSLDVMAMEAGSERNNEKKASLIALMGTERDPEGGVVQKHSGIRGDADAPTAWKFDPAKPVARVTITPMAAKTTQ
jgi:hypothetical protein